MIRTEPPKVEIWEANATLRYVMCDALEAAGFEIFELSAPEQSVEFADLLVVDVDGEDVTFDARLSVYRDANKAILFCGVRNSREAYPDPNWLTRPFSPAGFVAQCQSLLERDGLPTGAQAPADQTLPEDSSSDTQRLTVDDTEELERALGLQKGKLTRELSDVDDSADGPADFGASNTDDGGAHDADRQAAVLELAGEDIMLVDEPERGDEEGSKDFVQQTIAASGELIGEVRRHPLEAADLAAEPSEVDQEESQNIIPRFRSTTLNSTMPDVPAIKLADARASTSAPSSRPSRPPSGARPVPTSRVGAAPVSPGSGMSLAPKLESQTRSGAKLLAAAWPQIGCSARQGDRREHIEKILRALFAQGVDAGQAQVRRIPAAPSFSGSLAVLSLVDLLVTIRNRGLRGRLELAIDDEYFVLYLDAQALDSMENLTGNDDQLLLDILAEMGCLARSDYDALRQALSDPLAPPLQMQLRGRPASLSSQNHPQTPTGEPRALVDDDDLREARRLRTLRLFKKIRGAERNSPQPGTFAFMDILPDAGHAWPFDVLGLNVDELLEAARREDSSMGTSSGGSGPHQH